MSHYFIMLENEYVGPLDLDKISSWLGDKRVTPNHFVYHFETKIFSRIGDLPISEKFLPRRPFKILDKEDIYFIHFHDETVGPFSSTSIISLIEEKTVDAHTYIYHFNTKTWKFIKEYPSFNEHLPSPPSKAPDYDPKKGISNTILLEKDWINTPLHGDHIRKFARIDYSSPATVNFRNKTISGKCIEIGEGGCMIEMEPHQLKIGNTVTLRVSPDLIDFQLSSIAKVVFVSSEVPKTVAFEFQDLAEVVKNEIGAIVKKMLKE